MVAPSKTHEMLPAVVITAVPVVPAPAVVIPTAPPVSVVAVMTAVEGAPVILVSVLIVVPVDAALLMVNVGLRFANVPN